MFNTFIIGHGDPTGVSPRSGPFHAKILAAALDYFKHGVQVNVAVQPRISGSFTNRIKAHSKPKQFVHTSSRLTEISCTDALSRSGRFRNSKFPGADSDDNKILKCAVLAFTALCGDTNHGGGQPSCSICSIEPYDPPNHRYSDVWCTKKHV